jgi:hypothetical protein
MDMKWKHWHLQASHLFYSMTTHIVSWGGNDHIISPDISRTSSIVSIDSILPHKRTTAVQGAPAPESSAKRMSSLSVEPSGSETLISASAYARADSTDDSFIRHQKYFFKDGNVTFLVRGSAMMVACTSNSLVRCIQVDGTLYCVHRYFFSRDSVYFSTRFDQLGIRDHEALPITISLGNIESKDFDAFLSILYPE